MLYTLFGYNNLLFMATLNLFDIGIAQIKTGACFPSLSLLNISHYVLIHSLV